MAESELAQLSISEKSEAGPENKEVPDESVDPTGLSELDRLLFSYCELIDQYQAAQSRTSKLFADGFFSLAQANYASPHPFGRDYYHGSMAASKVMTFTPVYSPNVEITHAGFATAEVPLPEPEETPEPSVIEKIASTSTATETQSIRRRKQERQEPEKEKKDEKTEERQEPEKDKKDEMAEAKEEPEKEKKDDKAEVKRKPKAPLNRDPIRWFGVLVPHTLRESRDQFAAAVDEISGLLTTISTLSALEAKIESLRDCK